MSSTSTLREESAGSVRVLLLPDKEFVLKRTVFFMRSVYPHFNGVDRPFV